MYRFCFLATALLLLLPFPAAAQVPDAADAARFGFDVNAGYLTLGGDELAPVGDGFETEASLRYQWPSGVDLGVGAGIGFLSDVIEAELVSVFGEARYRLSSGGHLRPFVALRAGYAELNPESEETATEFVGQGYSLGGNVGLELSVTESVAVQAAALLNHLRIEVDFRDPRTGTEAGVRAGLRLSLD